MSADRKPPAGQPRFGLGRIERWLAFVVAVVLVQALWSVGLARVPIPGILAAAVAYACVVAAVLGAGALAPAPRARWAAALIAPAAVIAAAALWGPEPTTGDAASGARVRVALAAVTAALLVGGSLAGGIVGGRVRKAGYLIVVAYVSSLADVYSVMSSGGPSAQVAESERALSLLAVSWSLPTRGGGAAPVPVLGVGDVVMTALYLVAARQLSLGVRRTVVALGLGYATVAALLVVLSRALPALPILGVAVVVAHPEARRIPPEERRTALAGMVGLTALFGLLWWLV